MDGSMRVDWEEKLGEVPDSAQTCAKRSDLKV